MGDCLELKRAIYFFLYRSGFSALVWKASAVVFNRHPCIILNYHRIVGPNDEYLDKGPVVHHRVKDFEREILFFKKAFNIISLDRAVSHFKNRSPFSRPSLVLTFDDGYRDNYTLALPTLRKYGIPATIYVATGFIGSNDRTWTDQIELALLRTKVSDFEFPPVFGEKHITIATREEKGGANIRIAQQLKGLADSERKDLLNDLLKVLGIEETLTQNEDRMMLNWEELNEMSKNGFTIGAHSHTHPILSRAPLEMAKQEILTSKRLLEENLDINVRHFAFPNGRAEDFSVELMQFCRELGFESVASVVYGVNDPENDDVMNLKRIGARAPVWMLTGELLKTSLTWYHKKHRTVAL